MVGGRHSNFRRSKSEEKVKFYSQMYACILVIYSQGVEMLIYISTDFCLVCLLSLAHRSHVINFLILSLVLFYLVSAIGDHNTVFGASLTLDTVICHEF